MRLGEIEEIIMGTGMRLGEIDVEDFVAWRQIEIMKWRRKSAEATKTNLANDKGEFKSGFNGPIPAFPEVKLESYLDQLIEAKKGGHDG
jgi:hypothetical protein